MKPNEFAGGPSTGHPFSLDFRVFVHKRRHWSSSSTMPLSSASWGEGEKGPPAGRKGTGNVPGERELGRRKGLD